MVARACNYLRNRIICLRDGGISYEKIRKKLLTENYKISVNSIFKIIKKYKNFHRIIDHHRSGRKRLFSFEIYEYIDEIITSDR